MRVVAATAPLRSASIDGSAGVQLLKSVFALIGHVPRRCFLRVDISHGALCIISTEGVPLPQHGA